MSEPLQFVGRWKNIPVTMCVNHPEKRARARRLCGSCYVKAHYAKSESYRASSKATAKQWRADNPERAAVIAKRKNDKACPVKKKGAMLKRKYGISIDLFQKMQADQKGRCAICRKPPTEGKSLHVDHCHSTLRVRGLLCHQCNWYLGKVDADADLLPRLLNYVSQA